MSKYAPTVFDSWNPDNGKNEIDMLSNMLKKQTALLFTILQNPDQIGTNKEVLGNISELVE